MTLDCIRTLIQSEDFINTYDLEIILIESNKDHLEDGYVFPENVRVIIPGQTFNFHAYLNIGIRASTQAFVALCNNDLIFHKGWFSEILNVKKLYPQFRSFSPVQPKEKTSGGNFEKGYVVRKHVKGWCLVAEKDLYDKIGLPDEQFDFYYADDDYAMTLKKYHVQHALVLNSVVEHLGGENTETIREEGNAEFKKVTTQKKGLPKYLYSEGYNWILKNEKLLDGHLKFHKKWGGIRTISIKDKLARMGLGRWVRW